MTEWYQNLRMHYAELEHLCRDLLLVPLSASLLFTSCSKYQRLFSAIISLIVLKQNILCKTNLRKRWRYSPSTNNFSRLNYIIKCFNNVNGCGAMRISLCGCRFNYWCIKATALTRSHYSFLYKFKNVLTDL